jgi:hypothetical protein
MLNITHAEASANILAFADEGRLTQKMWHGRGDDGRDIACLLGSIHPSVRSAAECNGALMPMWLAKLTPTLFDGIPADAIYPFAKRYGALVARWHALDKAAWDRILIKLLVRTIDDAVDAARPIAQGNDYWPAVEAACAQSKAAIESGDNAAAFAAFAAANAARAAANAARAAANAANAAANAARAAANAAFAAANAARDAATATATATAAYAATATAAYAAAYAATATAADAAYAATATAADAYLKIANFILDQIEIELDAIR